MSEKLDRFVNLMKEIFELDKSDLDFGIYRIMNLRKAKIEDFLENGLPKKVQETLAPFAQGDKSKIEARIAEIEAQLGDSLSSLPDTVPMVKEYHDLKKQLASGTDLSALETDVYSALYSFFNRYYDEGDFVSKRRYKEGVYAIPYEGEEVKLYWANQDQYYIKTSENFKDYAFVASNEFGDTLNVHFELVDATTEQNNNKESEDSKRTFMLFVEDEEKYPGVKTFEYRKETNELIIRFVFDVPEDKKKKYEEENYNAIFEWIVKNHNELYGVLLKPNGDKKDATNTLQKHLKAYVAKNTFDYFIHKDLRGFLTRELDFYIKTEIMHLDDLDTENEKQAETYIAKIRAIKRVGKIIIDFLAQIEDFQKKLWLKKKFVVETNWCMTLDNVDESFWDEIISSKAQIDEWIAMYAIDEVEGDLTTVGWTNPPTKEFLRQNQNLVIDTKHFSTAFKERLLESIDGLDEKTNGLMINGDNFQVLRTINSYYSNKINSIYIDPPYNTDASPIMYKNGYKDSSWLAMIYDRLYESKKLMKDNSILALAIDDFEEKNIHHVLSYLFGGGEIGNVTIRNNPSGRPVPTGLAIAHEYTMFYTNTPGTVAGKLSRSKELDSRYKENDENGKFMWELLRKRGSDSERKDSPKAFYPIYFSQDGVRVPNADWDEDTLSWVNIESPKEYEIVCWPIDENNTERRWRWGIETARACCNELMYKTDEKGNRIVYYKYRPPVGVSATTAWIDAKYSATEHGTGLLKNYFSQYSPFSFPKSLYAVQDALRVTALDKHGIALDYFAGSGTTGHAVVNLNREDNGDRKYILIEMGTYFDTITKPRMQKVVYSADWKDGKPLNRNTSVSQIIKYMRLESYEDALSNIELENPGGQIASIFGDEYMIHYMIDLESKGSLLNLDAFKEPFRYEMKITEKNETKKRPIDVVETFNYLIGLTVVRQSAVSYFNAVSASTPAYEGAVDLIKDNNGEYGFKQIEGTLPDGRRALVIWRTVSGDLLKSNAALDAYFTKHRINPLDREFDVIYVNGDNNLENLRTDKETWKVQMTETEFKARMFEEE